jgi:hypothetical protein
VQKIVAPRLARHGKEPPGRAPSSLPLLAANTPYNVACSSIPGFVPLHRMRLPLLLAACLLILSSLPAFGGETASADPAADFQMAQRHFVGFGVARNDWQALFYLKRAAEGGHAEAQFTLGNYLHMYAYDIRGAAKWWRRAAAQGHSGAAANLAEALAAGWIAPEPGDDPKAQPPAAAAPQAAATPSGDLPDVARALTEDAGWRALGDDAASLQVFASSSEAEVRALAARHTWKRPLALLSFERAGQRWYALLYGQFPSAAAASQALGEVPAALHAARPWARRLGEIRRLARPLPASEAR